VANWRNIIAFLLLNSLFSACDDTYVSSVPLMPVSLKIDISGKYNTFKNSTNEFLIFEKPVYEADRIGYAGILVYSGVNFDDNGNSVYYAFDMACTHELSRDAKVYPVEGDFGKVKCAKCGTVYDVSLGFGNPVSGPSKEILRKYKVTVTETSLYVYR
jgi:nitrite reductase/ring-hydroxylating ferredoxin subunit